MFDQMMLKIIKPDNVNWIKPDALNINLTEDEPKNGQVYLMKGAESFLHSQIGIKTSTSKEVFKKVEKIWVELKDILLEKCAEEENPRYQFDLNDSNTVYLADERLNIVDIFKCYSNEAYEEFKDKLEKYMLEVTTITTTKKFFAPHNKGYAKLVCYDKDIKLDEEPYAPVVIIEFNNNKSSYKVYTGILVYSAFTFIPSISSYMEYDHASEFINNFDMKTILEYSKTNAEDLYNWYTQFVENPVEISARELINILKKVGYKLELRDNDELLPIDKLTDDANNDKIQQFFNTFKFKTGESAYDILALSELKKIFRYNKLTLLDLLGILSKEYMGEYGDKINMDILATLSYNLRDKQNDKRQAESIKKEMN